MKPPAWLDEALELLANNWRPREIAEHFKLDEAQVVDRLAEAGVEFRGRMGRESAARRGVRAQPDRRDELTRQLLLAQGALSLAQKDLQAARAERDAAIVERNRAYRQADAAMSELNGQIASLEAKLTAAYVHIHSAEPPLAEGCTKVRLRDRDEAWEFARRVAEDTGQRFELFRVYPCDICPRQPVGTSRFLHITSKENDEQRLEARARSGGLRKRNGTTLGDRIDPSVLARIKPEETS